MAILKKQDKFKGLDFRHRDHGHDFAVLDLAGQPEFIPLARDLHHGEIGNGVAGQFTALVGQAKIRLGVAWVGGGFKAQLIIA